MKKFTLAVLWGQYNPITKNALKYQKKIKLLSNTFYCFNSAQCMNVLLLALITDYHAVFFADGVVTSTAGESVLFVL